jgi:3-hydroxyacyl-[acyl-carrier-protein] dehydratase
VTDEHRDPPGRSAGGAYKVVRSYDALAVQALLAHRYPFLLVDRIDVLEPGRRVVGTKRVSGGEWWAGGDGTDVFPFALVVEALAQTSAALVVELVDAADRAVAYFMAADRVRFRHPARSGDELRLEVTLRRWRRGVCRVRGVATAHGAVVATAELTTVVRGTA